MRNKTRVENKDEKIGRKRYLKRLVAGFLGAAAFLKLTDIPKIAHAPTDTITGTGADKQIAYFYGTYTITGSEHLTWDAIKRNFIGGYIDNSVTTDVEGATISGGGDSGNVNKVTDNYGTVGGGSNNQAGDGLGTILDKPNATVGGGKSNTASGSHSTVAGGFNNNASDNHSTIGGGYSNTASNILSTVGGGLSNTASGEHSTVSGGWNNTASGNQSTVCGGRDNTAAGDYSFAAGRRANVSVAYPGTFLFADHNDFDFNSIGGNRFDVRCTGGARFVTAIDGAGNPTKQVTFGPDWLLTVGGKSKFGGWIIPTMDNKYKLGYGKKRWKEVWAANGTIQTSLSKFKENIESPSDIDYLSTVPEPIYFNWKDGDDKQKHLGFIGDHLPEVAKEGDGGVYTSSVTAILCGAIKQMANTIDRLEKRIEQLEKS